MALQQNKAQKSHLKGERCRHGGACGAVRFVTHVRGTCQDLCSYQRLGEAEGARIKYSRLLQELLAYNGGALVQSILRRVSNSSALKDSPFRELTIDLEACLELVALTNSQLIARFCLQEVDTGLLATALMSAHSSFMMSIEGQDHLTHLSTCSKFHYALDALRGIVNLARASKAFCLKL